jgi:hypothetical protein
LLRSLQEIQPHFEEEAKTYAGLWSQEEVHMYILLDTGNDCELLHDRTVLWIRRTPHDK